MADWPELTEINLNWPNSTWIDWNYLTLGPSFVEVKFGIPQLPKYDFVEDVGLEGPTCIKYSFLNMHKAGLKKMKNGENDTHIVDEESLYTNFY